MSNIIFYSTDDNTVGGVVKVDDVPYPIPSGSTVTAFIQTINGSERILDDINILESDAGNDWTNGAISGIFNDTESAKLAAYNDKLLKIIVRITVGDITQSFVETVTAEKLF